MPAAMPGWCHINRYMYATPESKAIWKASNPTGMFPHGLQELQRQAQSKNVLAHREVGSALAHPRAQLI